MDLNINEVAAKLQEANPALMFGIAESKGLIAVFNQDDEEWVPVISATITGQWVDLQDQGLPLVNGERVYQDSDFTVV